MPREAVVRKKSSEKPHGKGNARSSVAHIQAMLGLGHSRIEGDDKRKKHSLSKWSNFKSVDWQADMKKDYDRHTKGLEEDEEDPPICAKACVEGITWLIPAVVGVLTATSGCFIEKTVEWLGALRLGYCPTSYFYTSSEDCFHHGNSTSAWVQWDDVGLVSQHGGYLFYILVSTALATTSAILTWGFAPMARGSGIPEIKTILGGIVMPEVLDGNTLVVKIIGLSLSVAAGLSCGKEGPLVHIACCWSQFIVKFIPRFAENEAKQRELLSCACSAGVAVAFGAPLGGVLFSLEEASTLFPNRTMIRAFFAASVAAVTLAWWNPTGSKNGKLTMFEATYKQPPIFGEYIWFAILGCVGGCVGALFIHYNIRVSKARAPGTWFRSKCHIILEVLLIAMVTAITSYHLLFTKVLSNVTIRALFHSCADDHVSKHEFMLDLCDPSNDSEPNTSLEICLLILLGGLLRYIQMIFTFGTGAPAGLFIPSLYTGAAIGRVLGLAVANVNARFQIWGVVTGGVWVSTLSPPGVYSMIGAASVLGGVCRVTISLVVIMFELTSGLQLIVPFMVACMLAKAVGDLFTPGIYDYAIQIRKYPFLHEPDDLTFSHTVEDIMDTSIDCIHPILETKKGDLMYVHQFVEFLRQSKHGGYPLTLSGADPVLLGYIYISEALQYLERKIEDEEGFVEKPVAFCRFVEGERELPLGVEDLSDLVNVAVTRCVPETPAAQAHYMFRNLGIKVMLITKRANLVGMLTKKGFINRMEELHVKHGRRDAKPMKTLANLGNLLKEPLVDDDDEESA